MRFLLFAAALPLYAQSFGLPDAPLTLTVGSQGLTSLMWQGVNVNTLASAYTGTGGKMWYNSQVNGGSFTAPTCAAPTIASTGTTGSVTGNCTTSGLTYGTAATWTVQPDGRSILATFTVTNSDPTAIINSISIAAMGVTTPTPYVIGNLTHVSTACNTGGCADNLNPIIHVQWASGQWGLWNPTPNGSVPLGTTDIVIQGLNCTQSTGVCQNRISISNIGPLSSKTARALLRFQPDPTTDPTVWAADGYAAYRGVFPSITNWPDHRWIGRWFLNTTNTGYSTNPRGYFNTASPCGLNLTDPITNPTTISSFVTCAHNQAAALVSNLATQNAAGSQKPQGIIIWDIEGHEFTQGNVTYIGYPLAFDQGYAPEMQAAADDIFATLRAAGYRVGITLRFQYLKWVASLPSTCTYNSNPEFNEYYVVVGDPYLPSKLNRCNSDGISYQNLPPGGAGNQIEIPTSPNVTPSLFVTELVSRATYAHTRWGATIFYVDSNVWNGSGAVNADIFRQLQAALPDCLFLPEWSNAPTYGGFSSSYYSQSHAAPTQNPAYSNLVSRRSYPNSNIIDALDGCIADSTCPSTVNGGGEGRTTTNLQGYNIGSMVGDLLTGGVPTQMSTATRTAIDAMQSGSLATGLQMTITDSVTGTVYSYTETNPSGDVGYPGYPLTMREYFAATDAQLPYSFTYCAIGLSGENTCTLNLTNMVRRQVRFYDFAGNLVISRTATTR